MEILWFKVDCLGFPSDVCHFLGFVCRLKRDFRVFGFRYRIFSVFRERNLCVRVSMRLVDFFIVVMSFHEYIMVWGLLCMVYRMTCVVVYGFMSLKDRFSGLSSV